MKNKLTAVALLLSTAFIATGCTESDVTLKTDSNGNSIIYSLTIDGKVENFTANDLLKELQNSSTAKSALYSEISRQVFSAYADKTLTESQIKTINADAAEEVEEFKSNAKTNAKSNDTDYDVYLESALESAGVESLEELEALYIYNGKKSKILTDFVKNNYNYFLDKYLATYTPFQVKHVLVAANTADTAFKDGTMTADNARKLLQVMNAFLSGESFANVSDLTDDTSSRANGGVMPFNEGQNYVSEFRFAPYVITLFDNNLSSKERYKKAEELHLLSSDPNSDDYMSEEDFVASGLYETYANGIDVLRASDVFKLNNKITTGDPGHYNYKEDSMPTAADQEYIMNVRKYNDDGEINKRYYEEYEMVRNNIFNQYLNHHEVRYIEFNVLDYPNANHVSKSGVEVLADENGNPIYVVLASTGIHFMANVWDAPNKTADENKEYFKLFDNASSTNYSDDYKDTYIGRNEAYYVRSTLESNSSSLLSAITSYASSTEYFLFNCLVYGDDDLLPEYSNKATVSFYDNDLCDLMKDYVQSKLTSTDESFASSVASAMEAYSDKLARQNEVRKSLKNWLYKGE